MHNSTNRQYHLTVVYACEFGIRIPCDRCAFQTRSKRNISRLVRGNERNLNELFIAHAEYQFGFILRMQIEKNTQYAQQERLIVVDID